MQKTIAGVSVEVNEEGYFVDPSVWTEAMAHEIAKEEGIDELTEQHMKLLNYLREQQANGVALTIRGVNKSGVMTTKEFYSLFPGGPLKKASKIAGIPKPVGCI
ncbi:MAG: TusE/DsrC/DsvC family sulfur relay protein [Planctomycetaceae bacterium]